MSWLHPGLALLALLCALVPLIIFLIFFRRYDPVNWGAMEILRRAIRRQSKRTRLQDLILLLVRTALLLLLGLALARPLLAVGGDLLRSSGLLVILLDNTLSTTYETSEGRVFDQLRDEAEQLIAREGENSRILLLPLVPGEVRASTPTRDRVRLDHQLRNIQPVDTGGDVAARLAEVEEVLQASVEPGKSVVLLSDGQRSDWRVDEEAVASRLQSVKNLAQLRIRTRQPGVTGNVSLAWEAVEGLPATVMRPVVFRVRCRMEGLPEGSEVAVTLSVNDVVVDRRFVRKGANGDPVVEFRRRFREPGFQRIRMEVEPDILPGDNRIYYALHVREKIDALFLESSRDYGRHLRLALEPSRDEAGYFNSPFRLSSRAIPELGDLLHQYDLAVMPDAGLLSGGEIAELGEWVATGGAGLVFANEQGDFPDDWPVSWQTPARRSGDETPYSFELTDEGRDRLEVFRSEVMLRQLRRLKAFQICPLEVRDEGGVRVLLTTREGDPIIVSFSHGQGRFILAGLNLDPEVSDWVLSPVFAPLVHELARDLVRSRQVENLTAGEPWIAHLTREELNREMQLMQADGSIRTLSEFMDGPVVRFPHTTRTGFYRLSATGRRDPLRMVAANPPPTESMLSYLSAGEWGVAEDRVATVGADGPTPLTDPIRADGGPWLAWGALVLLLTDVVLAWWFRRPVVRKGGAGA